MRGCEIEHAVEMGDVNAQPRADDRGVEEVVISRRLGDGVFQERPFFLADDALFSREADCRCHRIVLSDERSDDTYLETNTRCEDTAGQRCVVCTGLPVLL